MAEREDEQDEWAEQDEQDDDDDDEQEDEEDGGGGEDFVLADPLLVLVSPAVWCVVDHIVSNAFVFL